MGHTFVIIKKYRLENGQVIIEDYDRESQCIEGVDRIGAVLQRFRINLWDYLDACTGIAHFDAKKLQKQVQFRKMLEKALPKIELESDAGYASSWLKKWLGALQQGYRIGYLDDGVSQF